MVETNLIDGLLNNYFGTRNIAELSIKNKIDNFVLISTDKAVNPTSLMGVTKRLAEIELQGLSSYQNVTCFSTVRFGNVLGSSGSVFPKFREQIKNGGPLTITHKDATRFFMTIPEASQLVIQAGSIAKGGEVFVLDMGKPVSILALAKKNDNFVRIKNLKNNIEGDISITFTGLRKGEKIHEQLSINDNFISTSHPKIRKAEETFIPYKTEENIKSYLRV